MKKVLVTAVLLFLVMGGLAATVCPPTTIVDPNSIDFEYDPNQVNYKLMCVVTTEAGEDVVKTITACDPDDDTVSFALQNEPVGMELFPGPGADQAQIAWTAVEGIYYVDVFVVDHPPVGSQPLEDRATMIFKVSPKNKPPVFTGCN